jgi:hypothetical protein
LRNEHLLFDLQIDYTRHRGELQARGFRQPAQGIEVVAEDLQDDLRAHTRLQMVESVRNGLADRDG